MSGGVPFGLVPPMFERPVDGVKPTWAEISAMVQRAEELGFDTVWTADEIVWRFPDWPGPRGWWECLTMTGAVAASSSTVQVGTWVMSAFGVAITGTSNQIAETIAGFADVGVTRVKIVPYPNTIDTLEQLTPVLAALI